jgi:hypothetical protein
VSVSVNLALLVIAAAAAFYIFVYVFAGKAGLLGPVCLFAAAYCLLHTFTGGWPVIKNWLDSGE